MASLARSWASIQLYRPATRSANCPPPGWSEPIRSAILRVMLPTYEACVTSLPQALAAERAGADRLEVCTRISTGGLTPPLPLLVAVRASVTIPIHAMIRPLGGGYVYSTAELDAMTRFIAAELAKDHWFSLDAARRDLGYTPRITMAEGTARLVASLIPNAGSR